MAGRAVPAMCGVSPAARTLLLSDEKKPSLLGASRASCYSGLKLNSSFEEAVLLLIF